jgi:hypothetical protein
MADALNRRIHDDTITADAPTVTAARQHRVAASDLILTRRNEPTIAVWMGADRGVAAADPVRNGDRWRVAAVDLATQRIAAERLTDGARAVFDADYVRGHITHGYATTVHSAQGVTADATHAVLGETTTRSMLYVAMTRGRDANTAYLYERSTEHEYGPTPDGPHVARRGTSRQAGRLAQAIIDTHDDIPATAHQVAATTPRHLLPDLAAQLVSRRDAAVQNLRIAYGDSEQDRLQGSAKGPSRERAVRTSRSRDDDRGIAL